MPSRIPAKSRVALYHRQVKRKDIQPYVDNRGKRSIYRNQVYRLRHLENRCKIVELRTKHGWSIKQISEELGIPKVKVEWYLEWSLQRVLQLQGTGMAVPRKTPRPRLKPTATLPTIPGPMAPIFLPSASSVSTPSSSPGPSEDPSIQLAAFRMRTSMVPLDEIADALGITPAETAKAIRIHADALNTSEISNTETSRRLQVEQIDRALRALTPMVYGTDEDGIERKVILEAVDRFVKLLTLKSKLLGLDAPMKIDMEVRLQKIAEGGEYDFDTLRAIFEEVVAEYPQLTAGL